MSGCWTGCVLSVSAVYKVQVTPCPPTIHIQVQVCHALCSVILLADNQMNMVEKIHSICCLIFTLLKLSVGNVGHGLESMDDVEDDLQLNLPVELHEGLVVTVIKRPDKCIRQASRGDILTVHYTGRFNDQHGEVFDTSLKEGWPPYKFQLGAGRVIQGYERGAPGMCRGETRTFQVPPSLAYGERGVPGKIPGNSTLHFTVECLSIADGELEAPSPPTPSREKVTTKVYQFMSKRKFYTKAEQETLKVKQAERLKTWVTIFFKKSLSNSKTLLVNSFPQNNALFMVKNALFSEKKLNFWSEIKNVSKVSTYVKRIIENCHKRLLKSQKSIIFCY